MTIEYMHLANLRGLIKFASPLPWQWATSNSTARLSSASGKDGDVVSAFRATDGVPCVNVSADNMNLIASAVNYLPELLDHIEDQAGIIAGLKASLETSCQQNQKQAARIAELERDNSMILSGADWMEYLADITRKAFERAEAAEKELAALREQKIQPSPVAVPDDETLFDMLLAWHRALTLQDAYPAMREVLRLNSGSKPFVVKLPPAAEESNVPGGAYGWNAYMKEAIKAIRAAGGEIAE